MAIITKLMRTSAVFMLVTVASISVAAQERMTIEELRELSAPSSKPALTTEREREVWSLVNGRRSESHRFLSDGQRDISDIVTHLDTFARAVELEKDPKARVRVYQLASTQTIASTEVGTDFLLTGIVDRDAQVRLESAKGLIRGPSSMHQRIDLAFEEYLRSPATTSNDRQVLFEVMCGSGIVGNQVGVFALEKLQLRPENEWEVFWLTFATLLTKGADAVRPLLDAQADPDFLVGALHGLQTYTYGKDKTMGTDEFGRHEIRRAVMMLAKSPHAEVRRWVYLSLPSLVGPNPYATDDSQLRIGREIIAAVKDARGVETDPETLELIDKYVLLIFADDGRLKTNAEFSRDSSDASAAP